MLNFAGYYSYVSVLDENYVFCTRRNGKKDSFMVICGLLFEISTREGHEPNALEVQMAIKKLKRHKSPSIDQIAAELIKAEDRTFFIYSVLNQEELLEDWKGLKYDKT